MACMVAVMPVFPSVVAGQADRQAEGTGGTGEWRWSGWVGGLPMPIPMTLAVGALAGWRGQLPTD